jgi:hypothetical protein
MNKIKLRKKKKENFIKFSFLNKMDSVDLITKNEIEDWALPHISKVVKEVNASNGQVKQVKFSKFFIEIMSNISNLTRYDKISKDSIVTYSLPSKTDFLLKSSPLFTV